MTIEKLQRYSPHHAITAPLGMMRYDDEGQYVRYDAARARENALLKALRGAITHDSHDVRDAGEDIINEIESTR